MAQDADQDRPDRLPGGLRSLIRYRVDNLLSRGTWAVLLWLAGVTTMVVLASSAIMAIFRVTFSGGGDRSWGEDTWQSLLRTIDSGTMAADVGWGPRAIALIVTLSGLLLAGTLIGLIANGVEQRVEQMQRGKNTVVETGHIVILGTSARLPVLIEQLAIADRARRDNVIVVLANREPRELREAAAAHAAGLRSSRLVVRSGETDTVGDLEMVRVQDARAVIVMADDDADNDTGVVKTVLAVGAANGGFDRMPIIVELQEPAMAERLARACGGDVHPVVTTVTIARLTSYFLREPGLRGIVDELMDARGCGIDLVEVPELVGVPFAEIVRRFGAVRPIGLLGTDGVVTLNPNGATAPKEGDRLVMITDHAGSAVPSALSFAAAAAKPAAHHEVATPQPAEHLVVVGWNGLGATLVGSVGQFCSPGSTAEIAFDPELFDVEEIAVPRSENLEVRLTPSPRLTWELNEDPEGGRVTSIVLLAYQRGLTAGEADSRTLLALMLLRQQLEQRSGPRPRVIVELRDAGNVELARRSGADDYIVSDAIAGRIMTQLAEQPERRQVLLSLYAPGEPSLRLITVADLGLSGTICFGDVVAAAQAAGLLAIGWRSGASDGGDVVLDPHVSRTVDLAPDGRLVVID
jgi:hypothetical protein